MQSQQYIEILLASYNGEKFIEEQINSILDQTHDNFQLIISDDGSTDNTLDIIAKKMEKTDKITLLPPKPNRGVIGNFAYLMQNAKAKYIMLADQDDIWFPDKIEKSMAMMLRLEQQHGSQIPLLVHTDLQVVDKNLKMIAPSFRKFVSISPNKPISLYRLLGQNVVTGCSLIMNQPLLQLSLPLPQETIMHDWWLALVAKSFGTIGYINEPTLLYRQHQNNQVGARRGNLLALIIRFLKNRKEYIAYSQQILTRQQRQAKKFVSRYQSQLSNERLNELRAFINWISGSLRQKFRIACKYGFIKKGVIKNLGALVISVYKKVG